MSEPPEKGRRFRKAVNLKININKNNSNQGGALPSPNPNSEPLTALGELVQCGICLEKLSNPRMLPCQHTFCLNCLKTQVTVQNLRFAGGNSLHSPGDGKGHNKITLYSDIKTMICPVCQRTIPLERGLDSLEKLPKNLYLESLLKVVEGSAVAQGPSETYRCVNCQTISKQQEQVCQHCMQIFCNVCWNEHLAELESNLKLLLKQLKESEDRLQHKLDNFVGRCDVLKDKIKKSTNSKIEELRTMEQLTLNDVDTIKKESRIASEILLDGVLRLEDDINLRVTNSNGAQKVTTYLNLHGQTSKMLEQVNYFGEARITFDPDAFKLEQISEGVYNDMENGQEQSFQSVTDPMESVESMTKHYKSRSFAPKLLWNKCPRPAGLGIPPWDDSKLLIAATDSHEILVVDRAKFKLVARLSHSELNCPAGITFCTANKEIFVSDKWKHCVHVFSKTGEYLRSLGNGKLRGPDGLAMSPNGELIICDCGNDRVLLVDPKNGEKLKTFGTYNGSTQLNFPTSVAVYNNKIIVADSGNNRVKIFNANGDVEQEFGSFGRNPGQFRSAEVVAVDPLGFILVGDAGNARIQVFKPDGTLVKILGSKQGFGWISGILVTASLDIIASDVKTRSLRIF
ncbi:hypothetical protein GWI33_015545 [Rhynchophorus ferrugineus]|uniref:RING-type domain-containing protein n=1 Tax=Rhynchophorus ferrugineus TaxID=354439 RepID=A0A834I2X1_RHYFE|nr:hypothetical protein GWI33_015545 [Rhynchophorus ferrugineus]